jgi:hypothetical protein
LKLPFSFFITMLTMQILDIATSIIDLSLGYIETNPFFSLPVTVLKIWIPVFYYGIYKLAQKICDEAEFKQFLTAYKIGYVLYMVIYFIILINNISVMM